MVERKPWLKFYGDVPESLPYPEVTLYQALMQTVAAYPDAVAYDFFDTIGTYRELAREIDAAAAGLARLGLSAGERITIAMPTSPQGVIAFYAANKLGAVACMIHPLSTPAEIAGYLNQTRSRHAVTLDAFYGKFKEVAAATGLGHLILARIPDYLKGVKKIGFQLLKGRKIPPVPADPLVTWWRDLVTAGAAAPPSPGTETDNRAPAVVLFSGGTTGTPKGILLSNRNIISEGKQVAAWGRLDRRDALLAILPIFHGFGLGVGVNAALMGGARVILVPQFTPDSVAKLIRKKRPSYIFGVPTLYEALTRSKVLQKTNLGFLKGAFCGADTLPRTVKENFEKMVQRSGGRLQLREGYGLTEAVTAVMAMPLGEYRENSIGVPFPDMLAKIVAVGTREEVPPGREGEICLHGPPVMLGYLDRPEDTARVLVKHPDGRIWLHTGDIGTMDVDGFFYFKLRLKRMIKSSGMNVYPAQVEDVLYRHPDVLEACVVGVPDISQVQRVKGFVVLKDRTKAGAAMASDLIAHCRKHLIKWSCPRSIEFRDALPKTLIGKVDFKTLEIQEIERLKRNGEYAGE